MRSRTSKLAILFFNVIIGKNFLQRESLTLNLTRLNWLFPSWHSDVVTTLSQRRCWCCHNIENGRKWEFENESWKWELYRLSVSDVVTTSLSNIFKTLPQRCYNVTTTLSIRLLGHFTTDYSDFFPFIETWKLQKC